MKMKLYLSLTSPYARKVRIVVQELGLGDLVSEVLVDPYNAQPISSTPIRCPGCRRWSRKRAKSCPTAC